MRIIRAMLIVACAVLSTQNARAAEPFDPFRPPTIGETIGRNVEKLISAVQNFREAGAQANQEIEAARKAFWSQYPNGPRYAATQEAFANALHAKYLYYLSIAAQEDCSGPAMTVLDRLSKLDGGIPDDAWLAFCDWISAVRVKLGAGVRPREPLPFSAISKVIPTALALEQFDWYKQARDWSEFVRAGKVPYRSWADVGKTQDPQVYAVYLLQTGKGAGPNIGVFLASHSFPAKLRAATQLFDVLAKIHSRNTMLTMAEKIMRAPRATNAAPGKPDQIVTEPYRMARADDLRKAGWNDAQATICSRQFIDDCYFDLIGPAPTTTTTQPNRTAADQARAAACDQSIAITKELAANKYGERVAAESAKNTEFFEYARELQKQQLPMAERQKRLTEKQQALQESYRLKINELDQKKTQLEQQLRQVEQQLRQADTTCDGYSPSAAQSGDRAPRRQPPAPARPPDILTNGSGPRTVPPNTSATTVQPDRSAAEKARAEACDQKAAIQGQLNANNRALADAQRKVNQDLAAYSRELVKQRLTPAESSQRYREKQEALKESDGVNAAIQKRTELQEQMRQAQKVCTAL